MARTKNIDRVRAMEAGRSTYTGTACKHCGGTERYVSNWGCVECTRAQSREKNTFSALGREYAKQSNGE